MSMLEAALGYAAKGAPVFPCNPDKSPLTARGFKDATTDETQIRAWWTQNPDALIGIPTGEVSGIDTLDFDTYKDGGEQAHADFAATHGLNGGSIVVKTGRGGLQYWYAASGSFPSGASRIAKTIDTRGEGGYTIVPPSVSRFGPYEFIKHGKLVPKPDSVEQLAQSVASKKERKAKSVDLINEGARNHDATRVAGALRAFGFTSDDIVKAITPVTTLDADEVRTIADSMEKYDPSIQDEKTEVGQVKYFARLFGDQVKFNWSTKRWMVYRDHWWEEDKGGKVRSYILKAYEIRLTNAVKALVAFTEAHPDMSEAEKKKSNEYAEHIFAKSMGYNSAIEHVWEIARTVLGSKKIDWDADPNLIGVKNGVVDLRTGELLHGSPDMMISKHIDIDYDATATCPRWEQFAREILKKDEEIVDFFQRALGYSLTGLTREQIWFFCHGGGSNGKSTAFEDILLKHVYGPYGAVASIETFTVRKNRSSILHDIADLEGVRFCNTSEPREGVELDEERIKSITTGGRVKADKKFMDAREFSPVLKLWLETNHELNVKDMSIGFWRRIAKFPFEAHFEWPTSPKFNPATDLPIDKNIVPKLTAEIQGILTWVVQGAVRYYAEGLAIPEKLRLATEDYKQRQDTFGQFIEDVLDFSDSTEKTENPDLYAAYLKWARREGMNFPMGKKSFIGTMIDRLPGYYRHTDHRYFQGIKLRDSFSKGPGY